jgi:hypothetical protein
MTVPLLWLVSPSWAVDMTAVLDSSSAPNSNDDTFRRTGEPSPNPEAIRRVAEARGWSEPQAARFLHALLRILHSIDRKPRLACVPDPSRDGSSRR